jgi:CRP-like cAMP-binding protein
MDVFKKLNGIYLRISFFFADFTGSLRIFFRGKVPCRNILPNAPCFDFVIRSYYYSYDIYVVQTTKGAFMNYNFLINTNLFHGIREEELRPLLTCLGAREKTYRKNEIIYRAGDIAHEIGLVESGSVNIVVNFYWGNSNIFGHVEKGKIFAENYAAIPGEELICDVVAAENSEILFLDFSKFSTTCSSACRFHLRVIHNLLRISALKSLSMSRRMMHTAPKSMRDKLLSYLSEQAIVNGSTSFTIPFNRQQLADYLGVDRSAMSAELSRMQKDGLLIYKKNKFQLNDIKS